MRYHFFFILSTLWASTIFATSSSTRCRALIKQFSASERVHKQSIEGTCGPTAIVNLANAGLESLGIKIHADATQTVQRMTDQYVRFGMNLESMIAANEDYFAQHPEVESRVYAFTVRAGDRVFCEPGRCHLTTHLTPDQLYDSHPDYTVNYSILGVSLLTENQLENVHAFGLLGMGKEGKFVMTDPRGGNETFEANFAMGQAQRRGYSHFVTFPIMEPIGYFPPVYDYMRLNEPVEARVIHGVRVSLRRREPQHHFHHPRHSRSGSGRH